MPGFPWLHTTFCEDKLRAPRGQKGPFWPAGLQKLQCSALRGRTPACDSETLLYSAQDVRRLRYSMSKTKQKQMTDPCMACHGCSSHAAAEGIRGSVSVCCTEVKKVKAERGSPRLGHFRCHCLWPHWPLTARPTNQGATESALPHGKVGQQSDAKATIEANADTRPAFLGYFTRFGLFKGPSSPCHTKT